MAESIRNNLLISAVLLIYTLLLLGPGFNLYHGLQQPASLIAPLAGIVVLFSVVLYIVIRLHGGQQRKRIAALEEQLAENEKTKSDKELEHHGNMEKKLFEIGIINASLNREIAERIQAETESRELQRQMELLLNSAGEGIFGLDLEGRVTFVNTAAALMTGWEREQMIGKEHHELVHHSYVDGNVHPPELCPINQACRDGKVHSSSDDYFWTSEGESFPVEYVSTPIMDNGRLCGAVVMFRDKSTFT